MSQVKVKEKVNINDGLPKADPQIVIDELKSHLYSDDNFKKYTSNHYCQVIFGCRRKEIQRQFLII